LAWAEGVRGSARCVVALRPVPLPFRDARAPAPRHVVYHVLKVCLCACARRAGSTATSRPSTATVSRMLCSAPRVGTTPGPTTTQRQPTRGPAAGAAATAARRWPQTPGRPPCGAQPVGGHDPTRPSRFGSSPPCPRPPSKTMYCTPAALSCHPHANESRVDARGTLRERGGLRSGHTE
jgi:hypothetical protein